MKSEDKNYDCNGKIFIFKRKQLPSDYTEIFSDQNVFNIDISIIGEFVLNNNIGFTKKNLDNCNIIYSPTVLCENNFMLDRNNYAGYIIIEDKTNKDNIVFIPFMLHFEETLYNDLTFTEVYSKKYQIDINDILKSVVTEEQYFANIYS